MKPCSLELGRASLHEEDPHRSRSLKCSRGRAGMSDAAHHCLCALNTSSSAVRNDRGSNPYQVRAYGEEDWGRWEVGMK